jgi:hypothetical protein
VREKSLRKFLVLLLLICCSTAVGQVSLRISTADGNTPFDTNTPIMVGTRLTIYVDSDSAMVWNGGLYVFSDPNLGELIEPETTAVLPNAGNGSIVWPSSYYNDPFFGFELGVEEDSTAGPWFVFDYNSKGVGDCNVGLYQYDESWHEQFLKIVTLHQVPTRDFKADGRVDFSDFAILASNWGRDDCDLSNQDCSGTDLCRDGRIDFVDMAYFADYWLEKLY